MSGVHLGKGNIFAFCIELSCVISCQKVTSRNKGGRKSSEELIDVKRFSSTLSWNMIACNDMAQIGNYIIC